MPRPRRAAGLFALAAAGWIVAVASGLVALHRYDTTAGDNPPPPASWPADAQFAHDATRPTLVVFVHPHCPCTRATVAELDRLVARCRGRLAVHVVLRDTDDAPCEGTSLFEHVRRIPGVATHVDRGATARAFAAATSGAAVLYGVDGTLRFSGGLTRSRGHEGDSEGAAIVLAAAERPGERTQPATTEVFGCPLCDPKDAGDSP